jgi:hypothetical protein
MAKLQLDKVYIAWRGHLDSLVLGKTGFYEKSYSIAVEVLETSLYAK